jgi:hypothetical protein
LVVPGLPAAHVTGCANVGWLSVSALLAAGYYFVCRQMGHPDPEFSVQSPVAFGCSRDMAEMWFMVFGGPVVQRVVLFVSGVH